MAAGYANAEAIAATRDVTLLIPTGLFLVIVGIGSVLRLKLAAVALTVPLAVMGVIFSGEALRDGLNAGLVLHVLFTLPILCGPAVLVYRDWSDLR